MRKKKHNKLTQNYITAWNYLKESKKFIYIILIVFLISAFIGFFVPIPESILQQILEYIKEVLKQTEGKNVLQLMWFIFWNNAKVSLMGIIFGIFLGVFPLSAAIGNGYLLGVVSSFVALGEGYMSLWKIFPHGIFELPAVFISLALGLRLGMFVFQKERILTFKRHFVNSLRVFLLIILPLLIIAAVIESSLIFLLG